ncbi:MAG: glycosyl hydrolase family 8 [Patescibacteria group bacterium]
MLNKIKSLFTLETLIIASLLLLSALAHGYNMFQFPYYENDEGVYLSQAWSLVRFGELSPYTYWYDHAPGGWIFIALWTLVTGGFFTFDFSLNTGRVFMLVLHIFSALFLYKVTKVLTKSTLAATISVLFFSLSPLGIYFQRRLLLDNIMVFWTLLSLYALIDYRKKLRHIILSAIAFGFAILSKETAVFLAPVYLYAIYALTDIKHRSFALIKWISIVGLIVSFYFIYALLKGELFPSGTIFGGDKPHVSLIDALAFQAGRKGGSLLDTENSAFWTNMGAWIGDDPIIIILGAIATIANLLIGLKSLTHRIVGFSASMMWIYLARGGMVIDFYIIPLIPLLALNIAVLITSLIRFFPRYIGYILGFITIAAIIVSSLYYSTNVHRYLNLYTTDQTTPQIQAIEWILDQRIPNAFFVIDHYGYIDLKERNNDDSIKTEWYWKVDNDSDVRDKMLHNDPQNIDFIGLTPQMRNDVAYSGLTHAALQQSAPIVSFSSGNWGIDFWGNTYPQRILNSSWQYYKKSFIIDGRIIDPYQENLTTSEGQSYALLRAVWLHDQETFDTVYQWTKQNMQKDSGTFAWKWNNGQILDQSSAADADEDIALALLFASKQWDNTKYLTEAKSVMQGIWEDEVVTIKNKPYLVAGNWADQKTFITINPSYLSPATYRIFAEIDTKHPWHQLVDTSYTVLTECTTEPLNKKKGVLPPEWCALNKSTLKVMESKSPQPEGTDYSYNAFRTPWRVALDYQWNEESRAKKYLESLSFLGEEYKKNKKLIAAYEHDGNVFENYESVAAYAGNLAYFVVEDQKTAETIYTKHILKKFYEGEDQSYWDDPQNYYTQNWAWFGTALYANHLPNLWSVYK